MDSNSRTAFTATLLLDRRQANSAAIAAVAVDRAGLRLYLGLEDGVLEEHAIVHSAPGPRSSLAARKHAAKKVPAASATANACLLLPHPALMLCMQAILGIHTLPDQGLVVLLGEDGLVQLLDAESLEGGALPLRCVHGPTPCLAQRAQPAPSALTCACVVCVTVLHVHAQIAAAAAAGMPWARAWRRLPAACRGWQSPPSQARSC